MRGMVLAAVAVIGCGDNQIVVTAQVNPAATVLVLDDVDGAWRPIEVTSSQLELEPTGPYGIAHLTSGVATVVLAGLEDERDWVLWNGVLPDVTLHEVTLRVVDTAGFADVTIGDVLTVLAPGETTTVDLPAGVTDLIAFRGERVIVLRDIVVEDGAAFDIDFERDSHAMVPRAVSPDSPFVGVHFLEITTRNGTRAGIGFLGQLPDELVEPGDRQQLRFDGEDVGIAVDLSRAPDGPLVLPTPTPVAATTTWSGGQLIVQWDEGAAWTGRTFYGAAEVSPGENVAWGVTAHDGWAVEAGRYPLPIGDVAAGWDPAYAIAPGSELQWWTVSVERSIDAALREYARDSLLSGGK